MKSLTRAKRGLTNPAFVVFLFVFILVTTLTVEFYNMYTLKEYIDTEMSRALNIATDMAIYDEYRAEHISKMDTAAAKREFEDYLHTEMGLNSANEKIQDGEVKFRVKITETVINASPADYMVKGVLITKPVLLGRLVPVEIEIPFRQKARNQRYE